MTDEEMAEEYADRTRIVDENTRAGTDCISLVQDYEGNYIDIHERIKQAYLAGLKAGRPKWHKPSEKLPEECSLVLAFEFENSEPALFEFVTSNTWEWMPRRIACLHNDQIKCWCEIPKYTEV